MELAKATTKSLWETMYQRVRGVFSTLTQTPNILMLWDKHEV